MTEEESLSPYISILDGVFRVYDVIPSGKRDTGGGWVFNFVAFTCFGKREPWQKDSTGERVQLGIKELV